MALAKSIYAVPTWTRLVALVTEHPALRAAICGGTPVPSVYACYRFTAKLRVYGDMLTGCIDRVTAGLTRSFPSAGNIAIDGSHMPAYANGQRYRYNHGPLRETFSDPDASWGHRSAVSTRKGGGFYGYKIDAIVCTATDLPIARNVRTAREAEQAHALALIDTAKTRGFAIETCAMDKGYDARHIYEGCEDCNVRPIIPLIQTTGRQARRPPHPDVRARPVALRGSRLLPQGDQVALPDRRLRSRVSLDQGRAHVPAASRARRPAGPRSTAAAPLSNASSAASSTTGRSHRSASVDWAGFGCTPT